MIGCVPTSQDLEIQDWYDLDDVRDNLEGSHTLMNHLDSTTPGYEELASPTANGGQGWQPIGSGHSPFTGSFDGHGYEIRDLFINRPGEDDVGLFGAVDEAGRIEDIGVVNAIVTGETFVGGLVGEIFYGTVNNSYFTGSITGEVNVGGMVGYNLQGTVRSCHSTGSVIGTDAVGGLVGYIGYNSTANVSNSHSGCNVTGDLYVGGLVGFNEYGTMSDSYSIGNVTGNLCVGGLVGLLAGDDGMDSVSNTYSMSNVIGYEGVGGLVGANFYSSVNNSYSSGSVTGESRVGGLVGENHGTVSNSFWDIETSGQTTSDGGTGKNTTEMQDIATFSGAAWNITAVALKQTNPAYIWNIVNNVTYPFLSWQP